jgi:membrane associated rhomboid family serine protease
MIAFYTFGDFVESTFGEIFGSPTGEILYLIMYVSALFVCLLPSYFKNKNNSAYSSLGASGAVSAVVFASILLYPTAGISLIFLPFFTAPAFVFGFIYLAITFWLDKRGQGGINHSAHLYGSLYGMVFLIVVAKLFSQYDVLPEFIFQIRTYLKM